MYKKIVISLYICICYISAIGQISTDEIPVSVQVKLDKKDIPQYIMPSIQTEALLKEDAFDEQFGDIPWRFGKDIDVDIDVKLKGKHTPLPNGEHLWQLKIQSKDAYSINLIYKYFDIPKGAKLFIFNPDENSYLGAYTQRNIKPDKSFATMLVKGDVSYVEYFEPANVAYEGTVIISKVIHGYKDMFAKFNKNFGSSGSCNNNVNCPIGQAWQKEKRSVAMVLLSNGTRWCSGALINNTNQDGMPYFLTANHCLGGENNWIVVFNYESLNCENIDGSLSQSIQYTTLKAANAASDFALVELSVAPPPEYNVYYSGWNRQNIAADSTTCIHHPSGDIKKISFDYDAPITSDYDPSPYLSNSHWEVNQWDDGTTEPGSSGSPLFNQDHLIVGQLHGGWASCSNLSPDYFGKFSMSWDHGTSPSTRLIDWLDPDSTGVSFLPGWDPQKDSLDAKITKIISPIGRFCDSSQINIKPEFIIKNNGINDILSIKFSYSFNAGNLQTFIYSDSLLTDQTDTIKLPLEQLQSDYHYFKIFITSVNDTVDNNPENDTLMTPIEVISQPVFLNMEFFTGNYGFENSYILSNAEGSIIYSLDMFNNNITYNKDFCLDTSCYTFIVYDDENDGLSANAYLNLSYPQTGYNIYSAGSFYSADTVNFCISENPVAEFEISDTNGCPGQPVEFINKSQGEINALWYFEGGIPEYSSLKNPWVEFQDTGFHFIQLKAFGVSGNVDSVGYSNYLHINPNPEISFSITPPSNSNTNDGSVKVIASGGQSPYKYRWNTGNFTNILTEIPVDWYWVTVTDANTCRVNDSVYVFPLLSTMGNTNADINVYPTVNKGSFVVLSDNRIQKIEILNMTGQLIYRKINCQKNNNIDLKNSYKGIYLIKAYSDQEIITKKIIIK